MYRTELQMLQAVRSRDKSADGLFVYGVLSTGIFCRPSCPSRQPNDENVRLFETSNLAKKAGFRACKRCKPEMGNADQIDADLVSQAVARLRGRDDRWSVGALAEQLGVSEGKLKQAFKTITGLTVAQFTRALKAQLLRDSLHQGLAATDAIFEAGYGSLSRVYEQSDKLLGMSPARYKDKGSMERIEYTVTTSDLGELLVAWTSKGVVCILLGDVEPELEKLLHKRFSKAEIIRTTAGETVKDIVKQIADPAKEVDLPLDIRGTAFQEQVWQALRDIPAGKTQTYQDVANNIGQPRAVRAVANACGANKLPIVIPCHRVVRSDGQVGGYAFGSARKKELLRRESESSGPT